MHPIKNVLNGSGIIFEWRITWTHKSFEFGNDELTREKSNNINLGFHGDQDALQYNLTVYHNWFDNFIYANTIDRKGDFRSIHYDQTDARFYGVDGDISYQMSARYNAGLFGDYVRAKLDDNGNAPRIPGGRMGTRIKADFGERILWYSRVLSCLSSG